MDLAGQHWLAENAASVLDAVVDAIISIDAGGRIISFNRATEQLFGYEASELTGAVLTMLMPEPYRSRHQGFIDMFLQTGEAKIIDIGRELTAQRQDGSVFPIHLAVSEVNHGEERFFVGIIRDLSDQKEAEDALREQRANLAHVGRLTTMGEMTASIAHEVNQPLTAIAMYAQACRRMLAKTEIDAQKIADTLVKLDEQSQRAGAIIERIQLFMQSTQSARELSDLNQVTEDVHLLAASDARLHGANLMYRLTPDALPIFCDTVQIQQVCLNLIRNALDAMFEIDCRHGTEMSVATRLEDGFAKVSVTDCGMGVDEKDISRLFTPFHTTKKDGMGMGLSICKTIIEDHGGELGYQPRPDGPGSVFYFSLPLASDE